MHPAARPRQARRHPVGHVRAVDDDEARVAAVQHLAERLQVVAAEHARGVARQGAQRRAAARAGGERAQDADRREERRDGADGEPPSEPGPGRVARVLVVPADDLHLSGASLATTVASKSCDLATCRYAASTASKSASASSTRRRTRPPRGPSRLIAPLPS